MAKKETVLPGFEDADGEWHRSRWREHWHDMPAFEDAAPYHSLTLIFRTKEAMDEFNERYGVKLHKDSTRVTIPRAKVKEKVIEYGWVKDE